MRAGLIVAFAVALAVLPARAADAPVTWQAATATLNATMGDIQTGGILAAKSHVADLEQALADGKQAMDSASQNGTVLTDGMAEMLVALGMASKNHTGSVQAIANPYPQMTLVLGSYYNEIGRSEDALRVFDLGMTLFAVSGDAHLGDHWPSLVYERGAALVALKRWPDVLAAYDAELKERPDMDAGMKSRFQRGRGFALTELGRLDDAEAAYRISLELEPGNPRALAELDYIAKLRAGGPATPTSLIPVQPQSTPQSKAQGQ